MPPEDPIRGFYVMLLPEVVAWGKGIPIPVLECEDLKTKNRRQGKGPQLRDKEKHKSRETGYLKSG